MCKRRNKILSMLLLCCMMVSVLMPLGTIMPSATSEGNKQDVLVSEDGVPATYKVGDVDYELVKGAFKYTSAQYEEMSSHFYYSDGYFAQAPEYYNEHLASFAAGMALAAMPMSYTGEYSEEKSAKYIVDMFNSMGCTDIFVHYPEPEYFGEDAENLSTIGYAIAKKKIVVNGVESTVIVIGTRGLDYRAEWASNVTLGSGTGEATGFGDAARQVKEGIDQYIADKGIDADSATFFITGYSRAAATSNLVAKKLTDEYGENKVYAYCFEAPKGGVASEMKKGHTYTNIHNIINAVDIVPTVGPAQMDFIRYGVDHIVPGYEVGTDGYNEQKALMLAQLAAINPNIVVDDTFHEATMEFVGSTIGYYNMISPEFFPDYKTAEEWIPVFLEKLQEYSMTDMRDKVTPPEDQKDQNENQYKTEGIFDSNSSEWKGYRNFYSNYMWYIYFDENDGNKVKIKSYVDVPADFADGKYTALTLEDAIANLVIFLFGMPNEKMDELTDVLGEIDPDTIMKGLDMTHIWWSVIDDWREFSIDTKNNEFHQIWAVVNKGFKPAEGEEVSTKTLEAELKEVLTDEEYKTLMASLYVIIDFALDFVSEDYNITDANLLGTLLYNIGNIMQTHYHDITYAWVRSYDSFYKVNSDDVIRLSGLKADGTSILIGGYSSFEEGWEAAVDFAEDYGYLEDNEYERIVVDLLADWNANAEGEFGDSDLDGFRQSTIYVPGETYITINLNEHTIDRGLGDRNELDGEVIFVAEEADLIMNGGTISGGNSDNGAGGIHVDDEATVTLNNVHVKGNTVDGDDGGGIALYDGATLIMNGGSISDNRNNSFSNCYGAGVYVYDSTATFEGVTFSNNQNTYNPMRGTVLYADEDSVVTMNNCTVVDNGTYNESIGNVGSISLIVIEGDSSVDIKNTEFTGNGYASSKHSSAVVNALISVENTSHFLIENCTFKYNSAAYMLYAQAENFEVVNTRFIDNPANVFYGYAKDSITFTGCEFNNNPANQWKDYYSFNFISRTPKVKFVGCNLGNSTFSNRNYAIFEDDINFPASILGEGSMTNILVIMSLIASGVCIFLTVYYNKKKEVPVAANGAAETENHGEE